MTSESVSMTLSRVMRRTGRRLSGLANVYHRISPRRTERLPTLRVPREGIFVGTELVVRRGLRAVGDSG